MQTLRYRIGLTIFFATMTLLWTGLATAETKLSETDKASLSLYGQVDRAILYANDGDEDYLFHVDNDHSSTRIGLNAKSLGSEKLTVGANFEVEIQSNTSNNVSQGNTNEDGVTFAERKMDVYFQFAAGKITFGQGSTASDGASEVDLSGTTVTGYSDATVMAGGIQFFDDDANALSGVQIKNVFNNYDGNSRKDRFRYDTPSFSGFSLGASTYSVDVNDNGEDKTKPVYDVAARWSGQFGDVKGVAAVAYSDYPEDDDSPNENLVNGSASVIWQGINLTLATGNLSLDPDDPTDDRDNSNFYYAKLGYLQDYWGIGETAIAVDFNRANDVLAKDDEATAWGLLFNQNLSNWSSEVFAAYRNYTLDSDGPDYKPISVVFAGARVKF